MVKRELDCCAPNHLKEAAKTSGAFQCRKCGLVFAGVAILNYRLRVLLRTSATRVTYC